MPLVSVIIPTYNWSEALRCSIPSVLGQSFGDFELLVIGDGCTDDSAQTVASFGDPRVRWHNLTTRAGCQTGPNNFGIETATGSLIAYLGHDDVWHPDHLRDLVHTWTATRADIVCSVGVMYGPPGSDVRVVSGVFAEGAYHVRDFLPPSTILHQRSLIEQTGPWPMPYECDLPIDAEWLRRAHQAGARVVSTGRLTAFKFNASWRRDSYHHRNVDEQRAMLARLRRDADGCAHEEWLGLARAARESLLSDSLMPPPTGRRGSYHEANLRARGLSDPVVPPLVAPMRFTLDDQVSLMDWHPVEHDEAGTSFRWSGPAPVSQILLPVQAPASLRIRVHLRNWFAADIASEVTLAVAGRQVPYTIGGDGAPGLWLDAEAAIEATAPGPLRLCLSVTRRRCPYFMTNGANADRRWLGVCVTHVDIEPA